MTTASGSNPMTIAGVGLSSCRYAHPGQKTFCCPFQAAHPVHPAKRGVKGQEYGIWFQNPVAVLRRVTRDATRARWGPSMASIAFLASRRASRADACDAGLRAFAQQCLGGGVACDDRSRRRRRPIGGEVGHPVRLALSWQTMSVPPVSPTEDVVRWRSGSRPAVTPFSRLPGSRSSAMTNGQNRDEQVGEEATRSFEYARLPEPYHHHGSSRDVLEDRVRLAWMPTGRLSPRWTRWRARATAAHQCTRERGACRKAVFGSRSHHPADRVRQNRIVAGVALCGVAALPPGEYLPAASRRLSNGNDGRSC